VQSVAVVGNEDVTTIDRDRARKNSVSTKPASTAPTACRRRRPSARQAVRNVGVASGHCDILGHAGSSMKPTSTGADGEEMSITEDLELRPQRRRTHQTGQHRGAARRVDEAHLDRRTGVLTSITRSPWLYAAT